MYGEFSAIGMAVCFSLSFVLTRKIEQSTTPLFNNTFRSIVGAVTFSLVSLFMGLFSGIGDLPWDLWLIIFGSILFNVIIGDTIYLHGQEIIGPANASAIGTVYPIAAISIEYLILKREIGLEILWAAIIAGVGVIYLAFLERKKSKKVSQDQKPSKSSESSRAVVSVVFAAISWAIGTVLTDISLKRSEEILLLGTNITYIIFALRYLFAAAILVGWSLLHKISKSRSKRTIRMTRSTWIISLIAALLAGFLGSYFNGEATRTVGASFTGIVQTALPVMILPLNLLINSEKSSLKEIIGIIIIMSGVSLLFIF